MNFIRITVFVLMVALVISTEVPVEEVLANQRPRSHVKTLDDADELGLDLVKGATGFVGSLFSFAGDVVRIASDTTAGAAGGTVKFAGGAVKGVGSAVKGLGRRFDYTLRFVLLFLLNF